MKTHMPESARVSHVLDSGNPMVHQPSLPELLQSYANLISKKQAGLHEVRQRKVIQLESGRMQELSEKVNSLIKDFEAVFPEEEKASEDKIQEYWAAFVHYEREVGSLKEIDETEKSIQHSLLEKLRTWKGKLLPLTPIAQLVAKNAWNDHSLVERIGAQDWNITLDQWNYCQSVMPEKTARLALVRLRGRPDSLASGTSGSSASSASSASPSSVPSTVSDTQGKLESYEGWTDTEGKEQSGYLYGTETEGGGQIEVWLKEEFRVGQSSRDYKTKKQELCARLNYFKRNPLVETVYGCLTIDNVMDKVDQLLQGFLVSLPVEIASKPVSFSPGSRGIDFKQLIEFDRQRRRTNWPVIRMIGNKLLPGAGEENVFLKEFNEYFIVKSVRTTRQDARIQHITTSGKPEDRLKMAQVLAETSRGFQLGMTTEKSKLSLKPKTSIEFLRTSGMTKQEVVKMEGYAQKIRSELRKAKRERESRGVPRRGSSAAEIKEDAGLKFADEELKAIILPTTGAPREVGGYLLTTPMTNAFPVIPLRRGGITVLRENREPPR